MEYSSLYNDQNHIKIKLKDAEEGLDPFLEYWRDLYKNNEYFSFEIDTTNIHNIPISVCTKMVSYIKIYKKEIPQYLKYSIMIIDSNMIRKLLNLIFKMQKPVSPVYIVKNELIAKNLYDILASPYSLKSTENLFLSTHGINVINP
jgi:hypothetical protein